MYRISFIFLIISLVMVSFCAKHGNRKMWEPSPAYIGVEPNDDAPVKAGVDAATNFSQDKTLTVASGESMAYLKFFIPGFSKLDSAVLRIQTKDIISAGTVSIYEALNKDWDETQITWDNRPQTGETVLTSVMLDKPQKVYQIDLTDFVKQKFAEKEYFICLCFKADEAGTAVSFASVEDYDNLKPRFKIAGLTEVMPTPPEYAPEAFKHPGILTTEEQIYFVKAKIQADESPWKDAFDAARENEMAQIDYKPTPFEKLTFTGLYKRKVSTGYDELGKDATATLLNAQLWALTDSVAYAEKSIEIIKAWAETLKEITGGNDKLTAAVTCMKFTNAAEILKHSKSGWQLPDQEKFEAWLRTVYWPLLRDFQPAYNGNWDALIGEGLISMGIYLDDKFIFDHVVNYYLNGIGNGKMTYYVREDGTSQETQRDQGHEQMGIGALAGIAEIAWHQDIDLYSIANNRLLKGIEGTAERVIKTEYKRLAIWELMYNHYHNRMGLDMPFTETILTAPGYRPEGLKGYHGLSTLFFYGVDTE